MADKRTFRTPPNIAVERALGAAVKVRAGGRHVSDRGAAQHRPCVHLAIPASTTGPMGSTHTLAP
jgi:hypothetical protein